MLHLVYCIKDPVQGYCMSSSFILGYFIYWHTFSMEMSRFCVLAVCMCCTVCVNLCVRGSLLLLVFRSTRLRALVISMRYKVVYIVILRVNLKK